MSPENNTFEELLKEAMIFISALSRIRVQIYILLVLLNLLLLGIILKTYGALNMFNSASNLSNAVVLSDHICFDLVHECGPHIHVSMDDRLISAGFIGVGVISLNTGERFQASIIDDFDCCKIIFRDAMHILREQNLSYSDYQYDSDFFDQFDLIFNAFLTECCKDNGITDNAVKYSSMSM